MFDCAEDGADFGIFGCDGGGDELLLGTGCAVFGGVLDDISGEFVLGGEDGGVFESAGFGERDSEVAVYSAEGFCSLECSVVEGYLGCGTTTATEDGVEDGVEELGCCEGGGC